jgi:hypothetical protein
MLMTLMLLGLVAGCGGNGGGDSSGTSTPVSGLSTPASVSVVSAQ